MAFIFDFTEHLQLEQILRRSAGSAADVEYAAAG